MFKNEYQGGAFVEIFSAQGKNPGARWKILGSPSVIWKEFDKEVKSFVFVLEGSSQTNRIQLPKENKQILGLIQRFLVLQIYVPLGQDFSTELLITDLGNIKRRLYLSTVHKELSSTPLHAKIPLFMIKRKIWCNLCIDLVAFTSEIFKGAVFQSLDGIIVSANCKLRKIFTLKSKPQDTADKDAVYGVPFPTDEPTDVIPRSCQLARDVPHVTLLLNMTKLRQTEIKFGGHPLSSAESDQFINRGAGSLWGSRSQDVCHIAFGSRVLGPPPLSGRRNNMKLSSETLKSVGSRNHRSSQQSAVDKCVNHAEKSPLLIPDCVEQGDKENICQIRQPVPIHGSSSGNDKKEGDKAPSLLATGTQESTAGMTPCTAEPLASDPADEWIFPGSGDHAPRLACSTESPLLDGNSCRPSHLWLATSQEIEQDLQVERTQSIQEDVFTFSSRPRSAPRGKTPNVSPEGCPFAVDLNEDIGVTRRDTQLEDDFYSADSSEEGDGSLQGSPGPTASPRGLTQLTVESSLGKAARWTRRGCVQSAPTGAKASGNWDSSAKQEDRNDLERSLLPAPCLSPPGRRCGSSQKTPDPLSKAEDLPVPAPLSKASLKEISSEKLRPIPEVCEYDWRNYHSSQMSESELQMLASLRRQQNEELEGPGASHGLSASQVDNCNVSISTSSDDTTTWSSCLPPPVNQGRHYQKEMNPPSPSNPRDWLNMLSPPIVPPSQQSTGQDPEFSGSRSAQGEEDLSVDEDEEVLTLLYDPCLNCYFDPQTGKYYELI
ncbi:protein CFAP20DC isoform X3 [Ochotona princeps]|uniref:protein CFAP20DC isoform X3 n=1 Tax=Ochotona princeps TaxID=9978 RepID=UPI002714D7F0|nr:protein CFAP20DC isoform X3 [Ochotona princeps]